MNIDIDAIRGRYQTALDQYRRYANRVANMGHAVQQVIDQHVTPRAQRLEAIHQLAAAIADRYGDTWPHQDGCLGDAGDSGCPLCRILHLSAGEQP